MVASCRKLQCSDLSRGKSFQGRRELSDWSSSDQWESSACRQSASKPLHILSLESLPLGARKDVKTKWIYFADFPVNNFQEFCVICSIFVPFHLFHPSLKTRLVPQGWVDVRRGRGRGWLWRRPYSSPQTLPSSSPHPPSSRASNPQQSSGEGGYQQLDTPGTTSIILLVELMVHVAPT